MFSKSLPSKNFTLLFEFSSLIENKAKCLNYSSATEMKINLNCKQIGKRSFINTSYMTFET